MSIPVAFTPFPSIKSASVPRIRAINKCVPPGTEWVVQEKIDGANFSQGSDEEGIWYASRNRVLGKNDTFYGYRRYSERWDECYQRLQALLGEGHTVVVRGELCGGWDPARPSPPDVMPVQKKIVYSPHLAFVVFDIEVDGEYLDTTEVAELALQAMYYSTKSLATFTTLQAAVDTYSNPKGQSFMALTLGLQSIAPNPMEGVIIRPVRSFHTNHGVRAMLKIKSESFCEKALITYKSVGPDPRFTSTKYPQLGDYVNEVRLACVESKLDPSEHVVRHVGQLMTQDVIDSFMEDHPETKRDDLAKESARIVFQWVAKTLKKRALHP